MSDFFTSCLHAEEATAALNFLFARSSALQQNLEAAIRKVQLFSSEPELEDDAELKRNQEQSIKELNDARLAFTLHYEFCIQKSVQFEAMREAFSRCIVNGISMVYDVNILNFYVAHAAFISNFYSLLDMA